MHDERVYDPKHIAANRDLWNAWTQLHLDSDFYAVDSFKAGQTTLKSVEREALGDVSGQTMLHLQCHFGLDTLSWAREGALVTGVDFSEDAIATAQKLSVELAIPATFVASNVYDLPEVLDETFDIVFTSYGVLPWLPDLDRWAHVVAHFLKPAGMFYIVEFHPFLETLDEEGEHFAYPYFGMQQPLRFEEVGSYASDSDFVGTSYEWTHPLGQVVTALLEAGLTLEYLREFPFSTYAYPPYLVQIAPDRYGWPAARPTLPLIYAIKATGA
ncbi:MAG TPA: class I SAM-dependent methyltransferase [Rhodothermales bacterium]|nr:class I SAM-dependent methyltransferase [Rhodothermales bacterium]